MLSTDRQPVDRLALSADLLLLDRLFVTDLGEDVYLETSADCRLLDKFVADLGEGGCLRKLTDDLTRPRLSIMVLQVVCSRLSLGLGLKRVSWGGFLGGGVKAET